jgi:hypothetical protein
LKQVLSESVLPVVAVGAAIVALTLALFDVPATAPVKVAPATAQAEPAPAESAEPPVDPYATKLVTREELNQTLGRALRMLDTARVNGPPPPAVASAPAPAGQVPAAGAPVIAGGSPALPAATSTGPDQQGLMLSVTTLGEAIKATRDARTEEDLVRAEEALRAARQQMEGSCGATPGNPLCDSAQAIKSLGF